MQYSREFIAEDALPRAREPLLQHVVDTYVSESNKVGAVWSELRDDQLDFRLHPRSSSVRQILKHQILSEARFFAEFIGLNEPPAEALLPPGEAPPVQAYIDRVIALARARLPALAAGDERFWLTEVSFFDVRRQRIWVFWRRVLHTAHHRAQIGDCLRLLDTRIPPTYGPTADVTWSGADPTDTLDAVQRAQR
ncbi:MAG TPA: DinB family protein [Gemmatimonadales bacterium]|nr:DinB family protein [Gemmatimonadales bacterium]